MRRLEIIYTLFSVCALATLCLVASSTLAAAAATADLQAQQSNWRKSTDQASKRHAPTTNPNNQRHHYRHRTSTGNRNNGQQLRSPKSSELVAMSSVFGAGSSLAAAQSSNAANAPLASHANSGQCPVLAADSPAPLTIGHTNDRVTIDEATGKRSFEARIVGIFSCLDEAESGAGNDLTLDVRLAKPAIDLAVKTVNTKYRHMHFNVTYRAAPDICIHQQAAGHAADEYYVNGANYFVGPGCSESLASVGQLASYWNVPMCSTGYLPEVVTAKFNPLTLMQLSLSVQSVGEMLLELFQMYRWRHLVIVTDDRHPLHSIIRDGLLEYFHSMYLASGSSGGGGASGQSQSQSQSGAGHNSSARDQSPESERRRQEQKFAHYYTNSSQIITSAGSMAADSMGADSNTRFSSQLPYYINITSRNFAYSRNKHIDYEQIMLDASSYSRIMLLLARSSTIGNLLEAAHNQGMSKGQFVFIAHELFETQQLESSNSASAASTTSQMHSRASELYRQHAHHQLTTKPLGPNDHHHLQQQQQQSASQQQHQQQPPELNDTITSKSLGEAHTKYALDDKIEIHMAHPPNGSSPTASDQLIREIFQPLMTISLRIPTTPEFDVFRSEVAGLSEREFNYRIQPSSLKSLYSLGVAALIYDCVMLYADKVDYVLKQTQFSKIDGKTIFRQAAGRTYANALTGDLTLNKAGQRVIDFTLNDFSAKSLSLEPIAHFMAIERRLSFLPGKQPHWVARNQSAPRSDPRCRPNDRFCRFTDLDDLDAAAGFGHAAAGGGLGSSSRFVVGVWLLMAIVISVTLTSSIIGWLVYRRFRIESELLNLWWSIKYEDILFEDDADNLCDGKRSMSSLAISNESFNAGNASGSGQPTAAGAAASNVDTAGHAHGRASPQQLVAAAEAQNQLNVSSVSHSLGNASSDPNNPISQPTNLSAAVSSSTLSVGGGSTVGVPGDNQRGVAGAGQASGGRQQTSGGAVLSSGAAKFLPLVGKAHQGSAGSRQAGAGQSGSGKGHRGVASGAGAYAKDPSISSQNKNAKLRLGTVLNGGRDQIHTTKVGLYKASRVAAKHLNVKNLSINRQLLIELRQVRDLTHENLIKFIGLCPEEPNVAIVSELCTRGNLQDLLQNETIRLDWPFRYSIINDIVDGLAHLHASPVQFHGRLKSSNCVIDNRFVVKLTDFGLPTLLASVEMDESVNPRLLLWTAPEHLRTKHPLSSGSQKGDIYSLAIIFQEIITRCGPFECEPILCGASELSGAPIDWHQQQQPPPPAPQLHQRHFTNTPLIRTTDAGGQPVGRRGTAAATAAAAAGSSRFNSNLSLQQQQYQMALMQPMVVQHKQRLEPEEIVNLVRMGLSPPFRPYFRPDVASPATSGAGATSSDFNVADLIGIVQTCWQEAPAARPGIASVKQQIKKMRRGCHLEGANLMDNLLQRMERYTDNLESLVEQKTAELMEEKKRSEELLYEMLPRFVVDQLKYGHSVTPEAYEAVTISFSDIKDFTSIAAQSSPIEVVNLLNQLYTEFDDCIARYDVYKVETIGDAYMVVSGLPIRNGDLHAKEIAEMSLALLDLIRNFDVVHLPHVNLELRIGIHSGPCASGVVGTRMFRYCLFGDTVNTASRMESHGEPMKIHISEDTANILAKFGTFIIEPRGQIEIKGKGLMSTYWLTGRSAAAGNALSYHRSFEN